MSIRLTVLDAINIINNIEKECDKLRPGQVNINDIFIGLNNRKKTSAQQNAQQNPKK